MGPHIYMLYFVTDTEQSTPYASDPVLSPWQWNDNVVIHSQLTVLCSNMLEMDSTNTHRMCREYQYNYIRCTL